MAESYCFIDIDGVMNSLAVNSDTYDPYREIIPSAVAALNSIIQATECKLVLSSSWRYYIHGGTMTLSGFELMLRTHGVRGSLVGLTRKCATNDEPRWLQIRDWLRANRPAEGVQRYCILDDDADAFGGNFDHGVQTSGSGLTMEDAEQAIGILNG